MGLNTPTSELAASSSMTAIGTGFFSALPQPERLILPRAIPGKPVRVFAPLPLPLPKKEPGKKPAEKRTFKGTHKERSIQKEITAVEKTWGAKQKIVLLENRLKRELEENLIKEHPEKERKEVLYAVLRDWTHSKEFWITLRRAILEKRAVNLLSLSSRKVFGSEAIRSGECLLSGREPSVEITPWTVIFDFRSPAVSSQITLESPDEIYEYRLA